MKVYISVRQLITLGVLSLVLAVTPQSHATSYTSLVVFGDSLSDSGNVFAASGGTQPVAPYSDGRFTSAYTSGDFGMVWVEHLAGLMGLSLDNSLADGTNYAFGGAEALDNPLREVPSLSDQVGFHLGGVPRAGVGLDTTGLFVVWAGGNDVLGGNFSGSGSVGIAGAITNLYAAGARNFLVPNLPDIGLTPLASALDVLTPGTMAFLSAATAAHNAALAVELAALSVLTDINIIDFDVFGLFGDIIGGFANVTDACAGVMPVIGACTDPDSYLFFDGIHPTAITHEMIGMLAYDEITPIPVPAALPLMLSALGLLGWRARRA